MLVIVRDNQGVGTLLQMDGFHPDDIQKAIKTIRSIFNETASIVFQGLMAQKEPEIIEVDLVQNSEEEDQGDDMVRWGAYNAHQSTSGKFHFVIYETLVRAYLSDSDDNKLKNTLTHELIHAADRPMILVGESFLDKVWSDINNSFDLSVGGYRSDLVALSDVLSFLHLYRNEGVALLGEFLIANPTIIPTNSYPFFTFLLQSVLQSVHVLPRVFDSTISEELATLLKSGAYSFSPSMLVKVLAVRNAIPQSIADKLIKGMEIGDNHLSVEEKTQVLNAAFSLNFSEYTQGILTLPEDSNMSSIQPFLAFCNKLQNNYYEDHLKSFTKLIQESDISVTTYKKAIQEIMGSLMPLSDIESNYQKFCQEPLNKAITAKAKANVEQLYSILTNDKDQSRKNIAHWALTYFFDDEDLIHDNIAGIGWVDDMIILETALNVINKR